MGCTNPRCNGAELVRLGATIGATKLAGCPNCYLVYFIPYVDPGPLVDPPGTTEGHDVTGDEFAQARTS